MSLSSSFSSSSESSSEFSTFSSFDPYSGPLTFRVFGNKTATVSGCDKTATEVTVPALYNGASVTGIDSDAFQFCDLLTTLTLPESVTTFGVSSFFGCSSLEELAIPSGIRLIWSMEFTFCSSLKTTVLPDGLIDIAEMSYLRCSSLVYAVIPASVISIGYDAFSDCSADFKIFSKATSLEGVKLGRNWDGGFPHYFYSENEKSGTWHFTLDGVPTLW